MNVSIFTFSLFCYVYFVIQNVFIIIIKRLNCNFQYVKLFDGNSGRQERLRPSNHIELELKRERSNSSNNVVVKM